jgi:pyruvate,water dikinase
MDVIRKCKAIIADWGGQTSHAAIVSRELQKPCIIGTNYASQVLKNGDVIKIDFKQGIIEVIKE